MADHWSTVERGSHYTEKEEDTLTALAFSRALLKSADMVLNYRLSLAQTNGGWLHFEIAANESWWGPSIFFREDDDKWA